MSSQGYNGLPNYYVQSSDPVTPNVGFSLKGMDPIVAENFVLADTAIGSGGTSVKVNGSTISNPNFNNTTPAAPGGATNVTWQVSGSSVSAYVAAGGVTSWSGDGSLFTNSGSTGAVTATLGNQTANAILAGPTSGGSATPTFRALVIADIPTISAAKGGTGIDSSSSTGIAQVSSGVWSISTALVNGTTATTQAASDNSTKVATTAYVDRVSGVTSVFGRTGAVVAAANDYAAVNNVTVGDGTNGMTVTTSSNTVTVNANTNLNLVGHAIVASATSNISLTAGTLLDFTGSTSVVAPTPTTSDNSQKVATTAFVKNQGYKTGTVTSFSAGNLSPLFTTSVATATTTPALSFALSNAGGGTVLGNNTASSAAPAYTTAPVLGIPGTSTGSIALASSTASGKYTITAPANAATPTLTLPTTSNVLAGQFAGDGILFTSSLQTASAAGTLTPSLLTQTANTVLAGPTTGSAATPTFRALVVADIPSGITPIWNNLQNATGNLTLANGANTTEFDQTSNVTWKWYNTTTATSGTTNASPVLDLSANYWTGAASAEDAWTIGTSLAAGTNGASTLTIAHTGSTGNAAVKLPSGGTGTSYATAGVQVGSTVGLAGVTSGILNFVTSSTNAEFRCYANTTLETSLGWSVNSAPSSATTLHSWNGPLYMRSTVTTGALGIQIGQGNTSFAATSGTQVAVGIGSGAAPTNTAAAVQFSPASGSANFVALGVQPVINQTSTASGSYTGILLNVVETSLKGSSNKFLDLQGGLSGGTSKFTIDNSGKVTNYQAIATAGDGLPSIVAVADYTAQSAAISGVNLFTAPKSGLYRINVYEKVTQAASSSSTLGGSTGTTFTYTDATDMVIVTVTAGMFKTTGVIGSTNSSNSTTLGVLSGSVVMNVANATGVTLGVDYTSSGVTPMQYEAHFVVEAL